MWRLLLLMIKCDISKCHASCCYNAPLPKKYIFALKNRIVTPVKEILVIDDENMKGEVMCYPITDHQYVRSLVMVQNHY